MKIEYIPLPPVSDPTSGYPGFDPHAEVCPKGYTAQVSRLPFACDTVCEQDVEIKLRDGVTIYADIYRPLRDGKVPAILSWGVAGKRGKNLAMGSPSPKNEKPAEINMSKEAVAPPMFPAYEEVSGLQAWSGPDPAVWVQHGYAIVNIDPRGVYMSEGTVQYFGTQDAQDGYDTIEFLAEQPWCSGKVGMSGSHWYGMEQWFIAAQRPPHLAAIAPAECHGNLYVDEFMRGGIVRLDDTARTRTYSDGMIEDICTMAETHPFIDEYWSDKIVDFSKIDIPAYVVASWTQTNHSRGVFEGFNSISSKDKWLRMHDAMEFIDPRVEKNVLDQVSFFDHFLKGADNGWEDTPRVRLAVLDPGAENITERPEDSFPLERQSIRKLWLDAGSMALSDVPAQGEGTVTYKADDHESSARFTLTFDEEAEMTGYIKLSVWVSADEADDADIFVRLFKLSENGEILYSTRGNKYSGPNGRLRASHRQLDEGKGTLLQPVHTHTSEQRLVPGEPVRLDIGVWPTGLKFHKGQKLMLEVSGYEVRVAHVSGDMLPTRNRGTHTIYTGGGYGSHLLIPIV